MPYGAYGRYRATIARAYRSTGRTNNRRYGGGAARRTGGNSMVTRRRAPGFTSYSRGYGPGAAYTAQLGPPGRGTEVKGVDSSHIIDFSQTTANIANVGMPIQVPSFYGRIANRTRGVTLDIRGYVNITGSNTAEYHLTVGRILVVYDRQPNGNLPSLTDILKDYAANGTFATNELAKLNLTNRDRFLILRDRQISLQPLGINGGPPDNNNLYLEMDINASNTNGFNYHEYINLKGLQTQYQSSSDGSVADISTGAYYIICVDPTSGSAAYQLVCQVRYKFYD